MPVTAITLFLIIWQCVSMLGLVPSFMLPSPVDVAKAFVKDFPLLLSHSGVTLLETFIGMAIGIAVGFLLAVLMDRYGLLRKALYPLIVLTQTIPTVAIAPLLVLWFGYEMLPKIILIVLVVFFPIAVNLLDGYQQADKDTINLLLAMGANDRQIFRYVKFPSALGHFFSSLKIAVSYAVVSAVIFLISALSLILMWLVNVIQKKMMPWENRKEQ